MSKKPDFKTLQDKWYKKLRDKTDFRDIEYEGGGIKSSASRFIAENPSPESWAATEQYYRLAAHFLNDYKFESRLDQIIWEYHANGISARNIVDLLTKARKSKMQRTKVMKVLSDLRDQMKLMYLPTLAKTNANIQ